MKNGWPIVEVMVNEQGPFSLILDTACTRLKLSGEVVDQLRLPEIGTSTSHNSAGQSIDSKTYGVETVTLGTASFRKIAVSRDDNFFQGYPDIDGIFGQRHFGKLVMTMDFEGGTLKLRKGPTQKNDSSEQLPITSKHSNPVLSLKIGEREIPFLIDTGMLGSLQVRESEVPTLPLHANRYLALQPSAGGLTLWQESTRLNHDLSLGKQKIEQPYLSWFVGKKGQNLIGMKILRHFTLELDLKNNQARFIREATTPIRFPNQKRLGFTLTYHSDKKVFEVIYVRPYQTQEEVLQVGDRLISIDGIEMSELNEQALRDFRETREELELIVEREGSRISINHPVQEDFFPTKNKSQKN